MSAREGAEVGMAQVPEERVGDRRERCVSRFERSGGRVRGCGGMDWERDGWVGCW